MAVFIIVQNLSSIARILSYFGVPCPPLEDMLCADLRLPNPQDMLGPEQGYDGMYGQGPPSVHSSHGGRGYQPQGNLYVSHFYSSNAASEQSICYSIESRRIYK